MKLQKVREQGIRFWDGITNQLVNKLSCWKYNISLEARL